MQVDTEIRKTANALADAFVKREVLKDGISRSAALDRFIASHPDEWRLAKGRPDPGLATARAQFGSAIEKAVEPDADDEREAAAQQFGKLVDSIQRNFGCSRSEAQTKAISTSEGNSLWQKWKNGRAAA
jgi:hypothetical protein